MLGSASLAVAQDDSSGAARTAPSAQAPGESAAPTPAPGDQPLQPSGFERAPAQSANPKGFTLPDDATTREVQGQYGIGITSLIVGGVLVLGVLVILFIAFTRRSWSAPT